MGRGQGATMAERVRAPKPGRVPGRVPFGEALLERIDALIEANDLAHGRDADRGW